MHPLSNKNFNRKIKTIFGFNLIFFSDTQKLGPSLAAAARAAGAGFAQLAEGPLRHGVVVQLDRVVVLDAVRLLGERKLLSCGQSVKS